MATLTEDKVRTASIGSSASSARDTAKPTSSALRGESMTAALAMTPPTPARPFPPPVVADVHRGWKPLGFLSILRRVLVKTPFWLTWLRILQTLLAGVVIGCLVWNLTYDDFSGYHGVAVALLFAAAWILFPTTILTWPLRDLRHVFDPRLTLFADGLATALWGLTFASYHAVLWNIETRTKFWATAEGPHSTPATAARPISTLRMPSVLPTMAGLSPVSVPTAIAPGRFSIGERSLMPHHAFSLETRGTRLGMNGLVSNDDANTAWTLGLIASYFALAEFLLYALTTILFAYYYHSALVADTATSTPAPRVSTSFATSMTPPLAIHTERVIPADLEAQNVGSPERIEKSVGKDERKGLVGKIVATLGAKNRSLEKHSGTTSQANDSGVFGLEGKSGIEVVKSNGTAAERSGAAEVVPKDVKTDGVSAR